MIFAAGLGTRLRPLTNDRPKAMVEVNGIPLLEIVIYRMKKAGVQDIMINVHHFADLVIDFLKAKDNFGIKIYISDERDQLLETGGGLKKVATFFDDGQPFLVHNTDIVSSIDLKKLYETHLVSGAIATLATRQRDTSRYLLFNEADHQLWGWANVKTNAYRWSHRQAIIFEKRAFSGIQVIDPKLFEYFPEENAFSIIDTYLKAARYETILSYPHDADVWLDAGKPEQIEEAGLVLGEVLGGK